MQPQRLALRARASSVYADHRAAYLAQLVAPMDDMWAAFVDMAEPHALLVGDRVAGSCAVDAEGRLLRFYVVPRFLQHSTPLLRVALRELAVEQLVVCTLDPNYLSSALDLATRVAPHTLLFAHLAEPETPGLDGLVPAAPSDHERIVEFQAEEVGAPRDFLEGYVGERIERRELLLFEDGDGLLSTGELRRDPHQPGISHVGLIVRGDARGRGIGSRMLSSLVTRSREQGLSPHCSTEVANVAARRAIERAGFRANHRLLSVTPAARKGQQ
ncbi:MAG: GNAT family N-acetyltransferase [bacterium]|nr:GNAT family N-acetyltransferase [bacterium]